MSLLWRASTKTGFAYLEVYAAETHQAIRRSNMVSVGIRNNETSRTKAAKKGMYVRYVPAQWITYKRVFICTHAWKSHTRAKGATGKTANTKGDGGKGKKKKAGKQDGSSKGKDPFKASRPIRFLRGIGCPFKFFAIVTFVNEKWVVVVHEECLYHNHKVAPEVFKTLAENRGIKRHERGNGTHNDREQAQADRHFERDARSRRERDVARYPEHGTSVHQRSETRRR
jgi:hypothetical protein